MHYVLSENVVYVVVDGFVTKTCIGHDLESEVGKLLFLETHIIKVSMNEVILEIKTLMII
jgi:hypothetical protein